ncbi:MAG: MgtC/SapB family protein [Bacteroidota bacterium]|nr:MgtC/SapB family protein [Bacteroidota bacterium]
MDTALSLLPLQIPLAARPELVDVPLLFQKGGICLLVGALVGLERERSLARSDKLFAGIRTFPLIALAGLLSALLGHIVSPWVFVALATSFCLLVVVSYVFEAREGFFGATSEIAAVIVFLLGALIYWEYYSVAIAASVTVTLFLSLKSPLQQFIGKVQEEDLYATLKFAIITAIILPVLPDRTIGPLDVLNPRQIWYMVVLIAGISFLGYIMVKILGTAKGISLTGLLGGMVSSTAVTLSFSQKSKESPELGRTFASAVILACSIMFPRILIEIAVVNGELLGFIWPFLTVMTAVGVASSLVLFFGARKSAGENIKLNNPFELLTAVKFGLVFAAILFVSKAAQTYFGDSGVFLAAALAGTTDVDAITLSMANLAKSSVSQSAAATAILLAVVVNTLVKAGIAIVLGGASLRKYTLPGFGVVFLVGILLVGWLIFS